MKSAYVKPVMIAEGFAPNECIAACYISIDSYDYIYAGDTCPNTKDDWNNYIDSPLIAWFLNMIFPFMENGENATYSTGEAGVYFTSSPSYNYHAHYADGSSVGTAHPPVAVSDGTHYIVRETNSSDRHPNASI